MLSDRLSSWKFSWHAHGKMVMDVDEKGIGMQLFTLPTHQAGSP